MKCNIKYWIFGTAASLAVASVCLVFATSVAAKGKPEGGGKTAIRLARILFVDSSGISWDGQSSCVDPILDETWDYWDHRDPDLNVDPECIPCRIDISGGGRVKFFTTGRRDRWLTFDFGANAALHPNPYFDADGNGPNIDAKVYPGTLNAPTVDPSDLVDNVKTTITLDGMFKKTAQRQPLDVTVRTYNEEAGGWPGAGWSLHSQVDLYIKTTNDPDIRILTTENPVTGMQDAAYFDLWHNGETVGTYYFPLEWEMRILAAP